VQQRIGSGKIADWQRLNKAMDADLTQPIAQAKGGGHEGAKLECIKKRVLGFICLGSWWVNGASQTLRYGQGGELTPPLPQPRY
jgi:hypothetical protein